MLFNIDFILIVTLVGAVGALAYACYMIYLGIRKQDSTRIGIGVSFSIVAIIVAYVAFIRAVTAHFTYTNFLLD